MGIHNPANLGMILRSATAAGLDGVVVPDEGTAKIGAVAIKASAGVAFKAPILRIDNVLNAVRFYGMLDSILLLWIAVANQLSKQIIVTALLWS